MAGLRYGLKSFEIGTVCQVIINGYSYRATIEGINDTTVLARTDIGVHEVLKVHTFSSSYYHNHQGVLS